VFKKPTITTTRHVYDYKILMKIFQIFNLVPLVSMLSHGVHEMNSIFVVVNYKSIGKVEKNLSANITRIIKT
jgi:hypothetical protein